MCTSLETATTADNSFTNETHIILIKLSTIITGSKKFLNLLMCPEMNRDEEK